MATFKELNLFYKNLYNKDLPRPTLTRWINENRVKAIKESNGRYNYDLESFKLTATSESCYKQNKAKKEKPENYIGKVHLQLLITGIVPKELRLDKNYSGTIMYCTCLRCGKEKVQVRFSYLTPNGNYSQQTCGCGRKERAFLASSRNDITQEFLKQYNTNFERFLFLHKLLTSTTDKYYINCPIEEYEFAIKKLDNDNQFNAIYNFWENNLRKENTFYDWAKPSLDHIIPKSKGGTNQIENLQVLTVFENLAKRDMNWEEWVTFKKETHTTSDYFIENILLN